MTTIDKSLIDTQPFVRRWGIKALNMLYNDTIINKTRGQIPGYVVNTGYKERLPDIDYNELYKLSKTHWVLRQIFRAIIGEVLNAERIITPRFKKKCAKCGKEYKNGSIEVCEVCGGKKFKQPDIKQYTKFTELLKNPSEGRNIIEFLRSTLWYDLALDDFYWEIVYEYDGSSRTPKYVRVLDGVTIEPMMDQYGVLGSNEYFCPVCYEKAQQENNIDEYEVIDQYNQSNPDKICKKCGGDLVETAYKQKVSGKIVARWGKDEIVYGSSSRIDPEGFGNSKILPCLKHLYIIDSMDEYNYQVYSHGEVGSLMVFPGADDTEVQALKEKLETELQTKKTLDVRTGDALRSLEIMTAFIGTEDGKTPVRIPLMEPLQNLQSIDFYRLFVEKVCGIYGVTPIFTATTSNENGPSNRMEIDVQNRVTKGYMSDIGTPFNDTLLPIFGITDWILSFGKIESRDELRDAQIKLTNAQAVNILRTAGFEIEVSDDMSSYTVSEKPTEMPEQVGTGNSRLTSGRLPQQQADGAPTRTMATGTEQGVPMMEPEAKE